MFIKDDALREALARNLHCKPDEVTPEKLKSLIRLDISDLELKSLEGLQEAENLEYLNASGNNLHTLDPIKDLYSLEELDVSSNQLRDIQALHGYRQLRKLNISRNNLYTMDISSVAGMLNLEVLNLKKSKVDSLEYLENCKKLRELKINTENGPFSYAVLGTLPKLTKLDMSGMRRFTVDDLNYITHIEELNLDTNLVSDISPLLVMKNLRILNVANNPYLTDYSILKQFPKLESLKDRKSVV